MSQSRRAQNTHGNGDKTFRGAGVYPFELIPAMRPGDYVRLVPDGDTYQVDVMVPQVKIEAFDSDKSNGVDPGNNSTSTDNEATDLEMPSKWLAQLRPTQLGNDLPDGHIIRIDLGGKQAPLYTSKNVRGEYEEEDQSLIGDDGTGTTVTGDRFNNQLMELYIFEDEVPYFTFEDTTGASQTINDLTFQGYQYRLTETTVPNGAHVEPVPTERVRET